MLFPLKDDVPSSTVPMVTLALIAANVLVFLYQLSLQLSGDPGAMQAAQEFVFEFGAIPCRLTGACQLPAEFPHPAVTIVTSMFLHAGLPHIAGNMWYLWIFGDNVEDTLGHGRFLMFYLLSGVAAALGHTLLNPASKVPIVGASGAISGALGAYVLLFPYARVLTLIAIGFFFRFIYIPAVILLGLWLVLQFVMGLVPVSMAGSEGGGVAWFAHIGGFLAGMGLLFLFRARRVARL